VETLVTPAIPLRRGAARPKLNLELAWRTRNQQAKATPTLPRQKARQRRGQSPTRLFPSDHLSGAQCQTRRLPAFYIGRSNPRISELSNNNISRMFPINLPHSVESGPWLLLLQIQALGYLGAKLRQANKASNSHIRVRYFPLTSSSLLTQ
jgi:hypothetical protein